MRGIRVAVLGAGAVGSYFGAMLARGGLPVTLIGREAQVDAIQRDGLLIERTGGTERAEVGATTSVRDVADANLVLLCVKTPDTEEATRAAAMHLAADTLVLSLQNGVDNVDRIYTTTGITAAAAAVYVAADLVAPGRVRHGGRGDLVIGTVPGRPLPANSDRPQLPDVARQFERCGVSCRVVPDIRADLWVKMIMNCAYNALSAIARVQYGELIANAEMRELMMQVVGEVVAVARASGVQLPQEDFSHSVMELGRSMPTATSSTAQDLARGRRTEIDALNGFIARQGESLGVAIPYNRTLHTLVKLLERRAQPSEPSAV